VVARSAGAVSAVVVGVLAVATMPVAVVATRYSDSYDLLHAGFAVPLCLGLGIAAVVLARRARTRGSATLGSSGGRSASLARLLGILAICIACSCLIALSVYGVLTFLSA
jgi:hypothetical protein